MTKRDFLDFICYINFNRNYDETVALVELFLLNMQTIFYWCFGNTFSYYLNYIKYKILGIEDVMNTKMINSNNINFEKSNKFKVQFDDFRNLFSSKKTLNLDSEQLFNDNLSILMIDKKEYEIKLELIKAAIEDYKLKIAIAKAEKEEIIAAETDDSKTFNTSIKVDLVKPTVSKGRYPLRTAEDFNNRLREDLNDMLQAEINRIKTYFFGPTVIDYVGEIEEELRLNALVVKQDSIINESERQIRKLTEVPITMNINNIEKLSSFEEWFEEWFEINQNGLVKFVFTFLDYYIWILFPFFFFMSLIIFLHCCLGLYSVYVDYYYKNPINIFTRYAMYPAVFILQYLWFILMSIFIFILCVPYIYIIWIIFL